jgi:hypothetical protein
MSQAPDGITGSYSFYEYLNAEINNAIEKGASPSELLNYVNEKLKITKVAKTLASKGLPTQIKSLDELPSLMPFEGKNKVSYEVRGAFGKSFFSAKSQEMFGIPPLTKTAKVDVGVLDYVNDPSLKNVEYGDIVSAIQFDKDSKVERLEKSNPSYHPSYPFVITGKPIMVFDNSVDVRKVFPNAKPKSEKASQVPLGKREKPQAARSAMGGQYVAKVPSKVKVGEAKIGITPETESIKKSKRTDGYTKSLTQAQLDRILNKKGVSTKTENDKLLQEEGKGNQTQRNNISTFNKFVKGIVDTYGDNVNILDIGAGLGIGAKSAKEYNVNNYSTYEPFPSLSDGKWEKYSGTKKPDYTEESKVPKGEADIVVNNAVLNVVPQDTRDGIVRLIGESLADGGKAYVSVRGIKESALKESIEKAKSGRSKNIWLSDSEYYVTGTCRNI